MIPHCSIQVSLGLILFYSFLAFCRWHARLEPSHLPHLSWPMPSQTRMWPTLDKRYSHQKRKTSWRGRCISRSLTKVRLKPGTNIMYTSWISHAHHVDITCTPHGCRMDSISREYSWRGCCISRGLTKVRFRRNKIKICACIQGQFLEGVQGRIQEFSIGGANTFLKRKGHPHPGALFLKKIRGHTSVSTKIRGAPSLNLHRFGWNMQM